MEMKTRQEMIYEFMLALAANWPEVKSNLWREDVDDLSESEVATEIFESASALADKYLSEL
jgi:hypothetical protein